MKKIKALVTGVKGQLGFDVVNTLKAMNIECKGVDIDDFDLTNEAQTKAYALDYAPDIIVHCAAYTAVDKAEDDRETCEKVNIGGTRALATAAKELGAKFVYISTDYVFGGVGETPFEVSDTKNPINHYGSTKYLGECEVQKILDKYFILRVTWTFGENGNNFVKTMLRLAQTHKKLTVVDDQIGSPTYTKDVAKTIGEIINTEKYGVYHVTNEGFCSWYEFACEIFNKAGIDIEVTPVTSAEYKTAAARPHNSRLSKKSLTENGFELLPTWQDALSRFLENIR